LRSCEETFPKDTRDQATGNPGKRINFGPIKLYMSLNDIELPDSLITALYGDSSLIRSHVPQAAPIARPPALMPQTGPTAPSTAAQQTGPTHPAGPAHQPAPASPGLYKFLGDNQKRTTILVDSPETAFLPDDQLAFLTKMLEACKMNIGDVAIVNQAVSRADITGLKRLSPTRILLFGPAPADIGLPINFPFFKIQLYDQCSFLWVPSLAQLVQPGEESKLLKTKLWVCLKTLFEI
jgi:hypothetical protein